MPSADDSDTNGHISKRRCCPPSVCIPWVSANLNDHNRRNKLFGQLARWSVLLLTLYWVGTYVHTETYVFQSTTLADWIRPVQRTECQLVAHGYTGDETSSRKLVRRRSLQAYHGTGKDEAIHYNATSTITSSESVPVKGNVQGHSGRRSGGMSIALLFLYDGSPAGGNGNDGGQSWNEQLMQRVIRNREEYARRHGYDLINANAHGLVDKSRPAAWSKLRAMDHFLTHGRQVVDDGQQQQQQQQPQSRSQQNHRRRFYDYILYIDMDVVIMDLDRKLETFIDIATAASPSNAPASVNSAVDFIMTGDWNGPNTGIWLARGSAGNNAVVTASVAAQRTHTSKSTASSTLQPPVAATTNVSLSSSSSSSSSTITTADNTVNHQLRTNGGGSASTTSLSGRHGLGPGSEGAGPGSGSEPSTTFASWFLREAWAQGDLLMQKTEKGSGRKHPFEYEQRAFHFLLGTPQWTSRGLRKYQHQGQGQGSAPLSEAFIRSHFHMFPQCAFNSYSMHPLDMRGSREQSQYVHGSDFLVHFAGKKGRIKVYLMEHYLRIAEASYQHTKAGE